ADISLPADSMSFVTKHSFCPPERRSDDGPPRTYTDGMTRPNQPGTNRLDTPPQTIRTVAAALMIGDESTD
ncbi:hypothetical protein, partial [Mycobacterium heckeshornense]|uniref:hypothetical protein n=1 Tax=Mycobacterium heckeshornense TaxID=110505 RepID=UPI0021F2E5D9